MKSINWANHYPRLYEIYCASDKNNNNNYFNNFDNISKYPHQKIHYEKLEKDLNELDYTAWQEFKCKVIKYVCGKDKLRAYEQLFNCFNEVKGYIFLKYDNYKDIHFLKEDIKRTPDIKATRNNADTLLEVKTINISEREIDYLNKNYELIRSGNDPMVRCVEDILPLVLIQKIDSTISVAKEQLVNYKSNKIEQRIAYIIYRLDYNISLNNKLILEVEQYIKSKSDNLFEIIPGYKDFI